MVQRGVLRLTLRIAAEDEATARALGLFPSAPAGVDVTLTRGRGAAEPIASGRSDASGGLRFEGLLEGDYLVSAQRDVGESERDRLPPDERDVRIFGGGLTVRVRVGENAAVVELSASRPGSIIISEIWPHRPPSRGGDTYRDGTYLELYNNADTIVYLDGLLFGVVPPITRNVGAVPPGPDFCGDFASVRLDSAALGAATLLQLPGRGRDHPLEPGSAAIIAQDAIDHRPFAAGALDLSDADFEAIGDSRDVDNPAVPNVTRLLRGEGSFGRGYPFGGDFPTAYFIARPSSTPLPRRTPAPGWSGWALDMPLVPRALILDVVGLTHDPEERALLASLGLGSTDCMPWLAAVWERAPAPIVSRARYEDAIGRAFVRRPAFVRPDGRIVLQRTRASARDWVFGAPATPGRVQW